MLLSLYHTMPLPYLHLTPMILSPYGAMALSPLHLPPYHHIALLLQARAYHPYDPITTTPITLSPYCPITLCPYHTYTTPL